MRGDIKALRMKYSSKSMDESLIQSIALDEDESIPYRCAMIHDLLQQGGQVDLDQMDANWIVERFRRGFRWDYIRPGLKIDDEMLEYVINDSSNRIWEFGGGLEEGINRELLRYVFYYCPSVVHRISSGIRERLEDEV